MSFCRINQNNNSLVQSEDGEVHFENLTGGIGIQLDKAEVMAEVVVEVELVEIAAHTLPDITAPYKVKVRLVGWVTEINGTYHQVSETLREFWQSGPG